MSIPERVPSVHPDLVAPGRHPEASHSGSWALDDQSEKHV